MDTSKEGIRLIYEFEGKHKAIGGGKYTSYRCPAGVWTIYCGLTKGVHQGMVVSEAEGERMFLKELSIYEDAIERLVTVPLSQSQFDALVSFVYNVGIGAFSRSTLLSQLNKGHYDSIPGQLNRWVKATVNGKKVTLKGLVRRRHKEGELWSRDDGADYEMPSENPAMPQDVHPDTGNRMDVVKKSRTFWSAVVVILGVIWDWVQSLFSAAGHGIEHAQEKLTVWKTLYSIVPVDMQTIIWVVIIGGALGVIVARMNAEVEQKVG